MVMSMDRIRIHTDAGEATAMRLLTWLSPAFPVGGFSYSHGIEFAVEDALVRDVAGLDKWIEGILRFGAGRNDSLLLLAAHRATIAQDLQEIGRVLRRANALRGTKELAQESVAQGAAFMKAVAAGWPIYKDHPVVTALSHAGAPITYPVAVGALGAVAGIGEGLLAGSYLTAFAANLVSAGVRLIPLGQSDGLKIIAALEPQIAALLASLRLQTLDDLGSAALVVDWTSMQHETQYTRLFRS